MSEEQDFVSYKKYEDDWKHKLGEDITIYHDNVEYSLDIGYVSSVDKIYVRLYECRNYEFSFLFGTTPLPRFLAHDWITKHPKALLDKVLKQVKRFDKLKAFS